ASMGPSPFSDGNLRFWPTTALPSRCFNGAVAFQRREHAVDRPSYAIVLALQWGRRLSATGTAFDSHQWLLNVRLQWGRRLSATGTAAIAATDPGVGALQWGRRLSATGTRRIA